MYLEDGQTIEGVEVERIDTINSNNFTIENCTIEWCINADHSNNCIIKNCTVGWRLEARYSNNCTVKNCTVRESDTRYSNNLQTYDVEVVNAIYIDEELFNLILCD